MKFVHPSFETEIAAMLRMLGCALPERSAIYVSSPITTGRRLLSLYKQASQSQFERRFEREVLEPNLQFARIAVGQLRKRLDDPVIDPTALPPMEGWTQDDYRFLWGRVIEVFAKEVVFLDGWEYSSGCVYEYFIAVSQLVPTKTYGRDSQMRARSAIEAITTARNELKSAGSDTALITDVLRELGRIEERSGKRGARVQR